jgi:hypothetical protein
VKRKCIQVDAASLNRSGFQIASILKAQTICVKQLDGKELAAFDNEEMSP